MKYFLSLTALLLSMNSFSQKANLSPEMLWKLGRVSGMGMAKDGKHYIFSVSFPSIEENKSNREFFIADIKTGAALNIKSTDDVLADKNVSPDGKYFLSDKEVSVQKVKSTDVYPALSKSNAYIIDNLDYRHWDKWRDGKFNHVFLTPVANPASAKDIMPGEMFDSPQKPFGGDEDYVWSPDSKSLVYVSKKNTARTMRSAPIPICINTTLLTAVLQISRLECRGTIKAPHTIQ
ncbi:MAG: hypothetical protein WKF88_12520 [Ferruginibacter sp.]